MAKRVTLDDIAAASGASPATVSLALRNRPGVSPERRAEILETARRLGYVVQRREGRQPEERLRNIGLIFRTPNWTEERTAPALNHFYSWVLAGIQDGAAHHRINLNLGTISVDRHNQPDTLPEMLVSQPLEGLLLVGAFSDVAVAEVYEQVRGDRLPIVLVDNETTELRVDSVTSDHHAGMAEATRYLIDRGHRRIAFAGDPAGLDRNFDLRRAGYADAMQQAGLPLEDLVVDDEPGLVDVLASRRGELTALACANDYTALLALHAARRAGFALPRELSVIGFDDTSEARTMHPTITTMAVDKVGMGRLAVRMMDYRLDWPEAATMRLSLGTRLVARESVGPPLRRPVADRA